MARDKKRSEHKIRNENIYRKCVGNASCARSGRVERIHMSTFEDGFGQLTTACCPTLSACDRPADAHLHKEQHRLSTQMPCLARPNGASRTPAQRKSAHHEPVMHAPACSSPPTTSQRRRFAPWVPPPSNSQIVHSLGASLARSTTPHAARRANRSTAVAAHAGTMMAAVHPHAH